MVVIGAFRVEGRCFESHSSRHVGTLGKFFTRSCLYDVMWCPAWLPCSSRFQSFLKFGYINGNILLNWIYRMGALSVAAACIVRDG